MLRFGQFYAVDSDHTRTQAAMVRRGIHPLFGPPEAHVALVGIPAAARSMVHALEAGSGPYNVVDDDPPTRHAVGAAVSEQLGRRQPRAIPSGLLRRINPASEMLMRSQRVSNQAFRTGTDWAPDDTGADGFARVVGEVLR